MAVKPIPEGHHTVTPYLVVRGTAQLIEFLKQAFAMRRKTLYNNLNKDERVLASLSAQRFPADARAEALSPEALLQIFVALQ